MFQYFTLFEYPSFNLSQYNLKVLSYQEDFGKVFLSRHAIKTYHTTPYHLAIFSHKWGTTHISVWLCLEDHQYDSCQVLRTQNETNKKTAGVPERKRIETNFFLPIWVWKGRDNVKLFLSLSTKHDFGKNSFSASAKAPEQEGCPGRLHPGHQTIEEET